MTSTMAALICLCANLAYILLMLVEMWTTWGKKANPYSLTQSVILMGAALCTQAVYFAVEPLTRDGIAWWGVVLAIVRIAGCVSVGVAAHRRAEKMMNR